MLLQNLVLYENKYYIRVNEEGDSLFYFFDYDERNADINMPFQHFHTFYELCIPLCPHTTHFLEGKPYELQIFDIIGIAPNMLHRTMYPPGDPCKRLIIQFCLPWSINGLSNEFEALTQIFHQEVPVFRFDPELRNRLFRRLNDIFLLAEKTDPMRDLVIHIKFVEFLTMLYLNLDNNRYANQTDMTPVEEKIYSVTSYIHTHYSEELSLEFFAQKFYISSYYLSHRFKEVTGFTLTDYIQMTRVRNVQSLLVGTQVPITEAALRCGFSSFSQFNRVFRKHIGMSPSEYRKQNQTLSTELDPYKKPGS